MLDINQLSDQTSLSVDIIRKYLRRLNRIFKPHIRRGDKNKLLFDNNCIAIFARISQLRRDGLTINEVAQELNNSLPNINQTGSNTAKFPQAPPLNNGQPNQIGSNEIFLREIADLSRQKSELLEKHQQEQMESAQEARKQETKIGELKATLAGLEGSIKLLTNGRSPEEAKKSRADDRDRKRLIRQRLIVLQRIPFWQFGKRKKILYETEELLENIGK